MQDKPIEIFVYDSIALCDGMLCTVECGVFVFDEFQTVNKRNNYPLIDYADVVLCLPIFDNDCVRCTVQQQKGMHINIASPPERIFNPALSIPSQFNLIEVIQWL